MIENSLSVSNNPDIVIYHNGFLFVGSQYGDWPTYNFVTEKITLLLISISLGMLIYAIINILGKYIEENNKFMVLILCLNLIFIIINLIVLII